jgi:hypothetical protein
MGEIGSSMYSFFSGTNIIAALSADRFPALMMEYPENDHEFKPTASL